MKKFLALSFAYCLSLAASAQMPRAGLVAYYPFNGNANDVMASAHHLTVNGALLAPDRFGNANSAYVFNGTSDNMSADANGLPALNSARTISAWFNAAAFPGSFYSFAILGYGDPNQPANSLYGLLLWNVTTNSPLSIGTWKAYGGAFPDTKINYTYSKSTWYHLAATYDGAGNEAIYMNGVLVGTNVISSLNTNTTEGVLRVGSAMAANSWFNGSIDDIAIYNRALSACEIQKLFDTTVSFTTQPTSTSAVIGNTATFTAQSTSANAQYQWQVNSGTGFMNLSNAGPYSGVNTATLSVSNVTATMNNYVFRCTLIQSGTTCAPISDEAVLTTVPTSVVSTPVATFSINPNPFFNEIIATAMQNSFGEKVILELSDITGRVVSRQIADAAQSEIRMQTGTVQPGVYFVRIYQEGTPVTVQKFLKQ